MTDQSQAQDNVSAAEAEIQMVVNDGFAKWRAARQQANSHGHITVADEAEMRRRITELERAQKGPSTDDYHAPTGFFRVEWFHLSTGAAKPNRRATVEN